MDTRSRRSGFGSFAGAGIALAGLCGLFGSVFAGSEAHAAPPKAAAAPSKLECVAYQTEAYFASVGYDHLVHLTNNCDKAAKCIVTTNVNPDPASVSLAPGEKQTLTTWRGSPAREFTADVDCRAGR
jgi:hypothetical protein